MSTLATLITDAADDPSKLNAIIAEIEGGSLDSDNTTLYPAPTFDAATNTWTLTQSTPNANGLYEGIYTLPGTGTCSYVADLPGTQNGDPKPFYCTRISEDFSDSTSYFSFYWWHFIKIPDLWLISFDRLYLDILVEV